jgi:hypothetical protein
MIQNFFSLELEIKINLFQGYTPSKAFTHWQRQSPLKSSFFEEANNEATPKRENGRDPTHLDATPNLSASKSPRMPMIYEEIDVDEHEKEASDDLFEKSMQGFSNVKIVRNAMMRQMYEKKRYHSYITYALL